VRGRGRTTTARWDLRDVALADFDVGRVDVAEEPHIEVGGDDLSGRTHALGEPARHRTATGADLEAAPAFGHPERIELAECGRVIELLDQSQPDEFFVVGVVAEEVFVALGVVLSQWNPRSVVRRAHWRELNSEALRARWRMLVPDSSGIRRSARQPHG